jgi:hypothetical protein
LRRINGISGGGIVHDTPVVIPAPQRIHLQSLLEIVFCPTHDIIPLYVNKIIPIGTRVLMPKSQGMKYLMNYITLVLHGTTPSQIDFGRGARLTAQIGRADIFVPSFVREVNVLYLVCAIYEANDARFVLDVLQCRGDCV